MDKLKLMQEWLDHAQAGPALSDLAAAVNHPALRDKEALDRRYENIRAPWTLPEYHAQSEAIRQRIRNTTAQEWLDMGIELELLAYRIYAGAEDDPCGIVVNGPMFIDEDVTYKPLVDTPHAQHRLKSFVEISRQWSGPIRQERGFWQRVKECLLFGS